MNPIKTYRIETDRLVIRCYEPHDAELMCVSINESINHLRPWMPWVKNEPETIEEKIQRIRKFRSSFDSDTDHSFGIFNKSETTLLGSTGLHNRIGINAREIGYWVNVNHINKGIATEAVSALTKVAFELEELNRIEIHCDSRNIASAAIPKKLGYQLECVLKKRFQDENEVLRDKMIWTLFKEDYIKTDIPNTQVKAFDIIGNNIPINT